MRIPIASLAAMNASDLVMFALGLALIVGVGAALGWNAARRVTRYLLGGRSWALWSRGSSER